MAGAVRIEDDAFSDPRIELLAALLEIDKFSALGRMAFIWRACTQANCYALRPAIIDCYLGRDGWKSLVDAKLGEIGDAGGDIRIRGTKGRIEWLERLRTAAKKGGEATKKRWQDAEPAGGPIARPMPGPPTPPTPLPTSKKKVLPGRPGGSSSNPKDSEKAIAYSEAIISRLNSITGRSFKHATASSLKYARGLISAGFSVADVCSVIEAKWGDWGDDPEMAHYVQPSTLFPPGKMQRYLDDKDSGAPVLRTPTPSRGPGPHPPSPKLMVPDPADPNGQPIECCPVCRVIGHGRDQCTEPGGYGRQ